MDVAELGGPTTVMLTLQWSESVNVVAAMDFQVGLCSPTVNMFILLRSDLIKQLKMYVQCTSLHILMRADVLVVSRTVSELSQFIVRISHPHGQFDSKFQVEGVAPHQSFLHR